MRFDAAAVAGGAGELYPNNHFTTTTSELYSLTEQRWKEGPKLPRGFTQGASISNKEHPLMLIGGHDGNKYHADILDYDATTNSFKTLPGKLKTPSQAPAVITIEDSC